MRLYKKMKNFSDTLKYINKNYIANIFTVSFAKILISANVN